MVLGDIVGPGPFAIAPPPAADVLKREQGRMAELRQIVEKFTAESEYFHSPNDYNVGRA
jgi:hypothetical protein